MTRPGTSPAPPLAAAAPPASTLQQLTRPAAHAPDIHLELLLPFLGAPFVFALLGIVVGLGWATSTLWAAYELRPPTPPLRTIAGLWWSLALSIELALALCVLIVPVRFARASIIHRRPPLPLPDRTTFPSVRLSKSQQLDLAILHLVVLALAAVALVACKIPLPAFGPGPVQWVQVDFGKSLNAVGATLGMSYATAVCECSVRELVRAGWSAVGGQNKSVGLPKLRVSLFL